MGKIKKICECEVKVLTESNRRMGSRAVAGSTPSIFNRCFGLLLLLIVRTVFQAVGFAPSRMVVLFTVTHA